MNNMKKRLGSILLVLCMLVMLAPVSALGYVEEPIPFEVAVPRDGTDVTVNEINTQDKGGVLAGSITIDTENDLELLPVPGAASVTVNGEVSSVGLGVLAVSGSDSDITIQTGDVNVASVPVFIDDPDSEVYAEGVHVQAMGGKVDIETGNIVTDTSGDLVNGVELQNRGADVSVKTGDITSRNGVVAMTFGSGGETSVKAGNITAGEDEYYDTQGVAAYALAGGTINVEVNNVAGGKDGVYAEAMGLFSSTGGDSDDALPASSVQVKAGDVQGSSNGIYALASEEGSSVQVEANSVSAVGAGEEAWNIDGIRINASSGTITITTTGDVSAEGADEINGITINDVWGSTVTLEIGGDLSAKAMAEDGGAVGAYLGAMSGSEVKATIAGDVSAEGDYAVGAAVWAVDDGTVTLQVGGDLSGLAAGLFVQAASDEELDLKPTATAIIEGTLSGGQPIVVHDEDGLAALSLTVWKIEPAEDNSLIGLGYEPEDEEDEALLVECAEKEKEIAYIIKLEQPERGGTGTLGGVAQINGFNTAREGEKVTLAANVQDGYRLVGAYNNGVQLLQDESGAFYIVVPKGGGISLSLALEQIGQQGFVQQGAGTTRIGRAEATSSEGRPCALIFYDNGRYKLEVDGQTMERGYTEMIDGVLTLCAPHGVRMPVQDDGTVVYRIGGSDSNTATFHLDKSLVEQLKGIVEQLKEIV